MTGKRPRGQKVINQRNKNSNINCILGTVSGTGSSHQIPLRIKNKMNEEIVERNSYNNLL